MNARFLRATGHLHTIPLLPRTIKANRILDDPCRYPPFNLYTTTSVLQRRGINGPCHPVRNKSPCIVYRDFSKKREEMRQYSTFSEWKRRERVPRQSSPITGTGEDMLEYFLHDSTAATANVADPREAHWRGSRG